jgi:hypothetical protein
MGYEFASRSSNLRSFIQLDTGVPFYRLDTPGGTMSAPSAALISFGIGGAR